MPTPVFPCTEIYSIVNLDKMVRDFYLGRARIGEALEVGDGKMPLIT